MLKKIAHYSSIGSLIGLMFICVLWEGFLSPMRSGGSFMILKTLPLLVPLFGILKEKKYTYQWSSMFILFYFTEGIMRGYAEKGIGQTLALWEVFLSSVFFLSAIIYVRSLRQS